MKKQIRLLIEGLFDDIYAVEDEKNIDTEIADKLITYKIGDVYYKNKEPYAVCASTEDSFQDFKQRFMLITNESPRLIWSEKQIKYDNFNYENYHQYDEIIEEIEQYDNVDESIFGADAKRYSGFKIKNDWNTFIEIDEKGYENTQMIKNNFDLSKFPAFKYCCELGDNVYLPAIDELQVMYIFKNKLEQTPLILPKSNTSIWSSSVLFLDQPYFLNYYKKTDIGVINNVSIYDNNFCNVLPFVKIKI